MCSSVTRPRADREVHPPPHLRVVRHLIRHIVRVLEVQRPLEVRQRLVVARDAALPNPRPHHPVIVRLLVDRQPAYQSCGPRSAFDARMIGNAARVRRLADDHRLVQHQQVDAGEPAHPRLRPRLELDPPAVLQRDRLLTMRVPVADDLPRRPPLHLPCNSGASPAPPPRAAGNAPRSS